jgi:Flp pilus assembly pilin Flp
MQSPRAVEALLKIGNSRFHLSDDGQDLLEYGLLVALIAIIAMAGVTAVGQTIYTVFWQSIASNF